MSADTAEQATPAATAEKPFDWADDALKNDVNMLLGAEGIALDRRQRNSEMAYALTEFAATKDQALLAKRMAKLNGDGSLEDTEMGVSVGNTITQNFYGPQPSTAAATTGANQATAAPAGLPTAPAATTPEAPAAPVAAASAGDAPVASGLPGWVKTAAIVGGSLIAGGGGAAIVNAVTSDSATIINPAPAASSPYDIQGGVTPLGK